MLDVEGLGEKIIDQLLELDRMGEVSTDKLLAAIDGARPPSR
ncbi:hypothetical protein [Actinoallomurus acanthiterrae]